jgi:hypothetical protein
MKPLPKTFKSGGFHFKQLMREGNVALFAKAKPHFTRESYEVVVVQQRPGGVFKGKPFPPHESMPPSESWGRLGWSYSDKESATRRFSQLCDRAANAANLAKPPSRGAFSEQEKATGSAQTPLEAVCV